MIGGHTYLGNHLPDRHELWLQSLWESVLENPWESAGEPMGGYAGGLLEVQVAMRVVLHCVRLAFPKVLQRKV